MESAKNNSNLVSPFKPDEIEFSLLDYSVFWGMLLISLCIGIYYGFISKKKQDSTVEYLMGSKQMNIYPVSISMIASHISAVTILGVPAEMYQFGTQYWASAFSGFIVVVIVINLYLPVFYDLQYTTMFTYLEERFDVKLRKLASALFIISTIISLPVSIYGPALAFNQVTGISLHAITPIMCVICIFYTMVGGIRAVVWTDTIQFISMVGGILVVVVLGIYSIGGLTNIYDIAEKGDRIVWFNMDTSSTVRSSFHTTVFGLTALWLSGIALSPEYTQRILSVPTIEDSKKVVYLFGIGHIIIKLLSVFTGILIYDRYSSCDPVTIGIIKKPDQILPYYVMDMTRNIPMISGIFVAGVFSASLSSMSSSLNSIAGVIYVDFLKAMYPDVSEKMSSNIMKVIVLFVGCISIALVFVVERLGNIFSIAISLSGLTAGPLLGLFTMGMTVPRANKHGAYWGALVSMIIVATITIGSQIAIASKNLLYETLPFHTDGCDEMGFSNWKNSSAFIGNTTSTVHIHNENADHSNVYPLFRIHFMYNTLIGAIIVFIVGIPLSYFIGKPEDVNQRLLAHFLRPHYEKKIKTPCMNLSEIKPLNIMRESEKSELN